MEEKVSIIIPVYNVEIWLDECIESVIKQTYENIEIILVDDGSTDNSGKKCDEWKKKDDRIVVIHKKNGGLSSARNAGLDVLTGSYITFLDSDDYIESETIEGMLIGIKNKNVDIVCCAMNRVIGDKIIPNKNIDKEKFYTSEQLLDGFYYYQEGLCGSVCDKMFKVNLFDKLRFPEGINSEDYYALFYLYLKSNGMFYNNKCYYNYRMRENSICTIEKLNEHSFDKIRISDVIRKKTEEVIPERQKDAIAYQIISRFYTYSRTMSLEHSKKLEAGWKRDLKKYKRNMLENKKLEKKFKLKYIALLYFPHLYLKIEKKYEKDKMKKMKK